MKKKILVAIAYLMNLTLLSTQALADDNVNSYLVYEKLLLDRTGNIVIGKNENIESIQFKDNYWIVKPNTPYSYNFSNTHEISNFKYAFEKKNNILKFKIRDNLTYLGKERLAYYYRDSKLSVLIDTDGNLITPKGIYYKEIEPFYEGYAQVKTKKGEWGYLDSEGNFFKNRPPNIQSPSKMVSDQNCDIITNDNIIKLCKKDKSKYLINTQKGKEIDVGPMASYINFHQSNTNYFWIINYKHSYKIYQIYDYEGKMLYENDFYSISEIRGKTSWVAKKDKEKRLIDVTTGKTIGLFDYYHEVKNGKEILYYAYKKSGKQNLLSIIDSNGKNLFHEEIVDPEQYIDCKSELKVLKDSENKLIWPTSIEKECLLNRVITSGTKDSIYGSSVDDTPVSYDKLDYIKNYFIKKESKFTALSIDYHQHPVYLAGPAIINIDDIGELSIPEGYIYSAKNDYLGNELCNRFVMPAYDSKNRLCINSYKLGFINLLEAKKFFDDPTKIKELKTQMARLYGNNRELEWLIDPEFDFENQTLKFGFREDFTEKSSFKSLQAIEYVKFAKDHIIVMKNDYSGYYGDFKPMEHDWVKHINVYSKADIMSDYPCSKLSLMDSALSANRLPYLDKDFCFPLPVTGLLTSGNNKFDYYHELFGFRRIEYEIVRRYY